MGLDSFAQLAVQGHREPFPIQPEAGGYLDQHPTICDPEAFNIVGYLQLSEHVQSPPGQFLRSQHGRRWGL